MQRIAEDSPSGGTQGQPRLKQRLGLPFDPAGVVKLVEQACQIERIPGDPGRIELPGRRRDLLRKSGEKADELPFLRRRLK